MANRKVAPANAAMGFTRVRDAFCRSILPRGVFRSELRPSNDKGVQECTDDNECALRLVPGYMGKGKRLVWRGLTSALTGGGRR